MLTSKKEIECVAREGKGGLFGFLVNTPRWVVENAVQCRQSIIILNY